MKGVLQGRNEGGGVGWGWVGGVDAVNVPPLEVLYISNCALAY